MEFKQEKLIEREIEIGDYLVHGSSLTYISQKTGLSKKHLEAHIKNMMVKLQAENMEGLIKWLKGFKQGNVR
jgi:DNA-binding NarL/FixJ family response regulator